MEHSPQDLTAATFAIVKKGYDPAEVRTYLGSVAKTLENAQQQAAAMEARARAAVAKLQELSQVQPPPAPAPAGDSETSGDAAAISRALVVAQRTADGLIAEARTEADTMVSAARAEAASIVADARRDAEQMIDDGRTEGRRSQEAEVARAEGEVQALLARRDFLVSDVDHLEEFTATQRQRLIEAADAIRATAESVAEHRRPLLSAAADTAARETAIDGADELSEGDGASSMNSDNDAAPAGDAPSDADAHRTSTLAVLVDDAHDSDDSGDDEPTPVGNPNLLDFDTGGEGR